MATFNRLSLTVERGDVPTRYRRKRPKVQRGMFGTHRYDLRHVHERSATVDGGTVYLRGSVVQVWWTNDEAMGEDRPETWALPDSPHNREQARLNFWSMVQRWQ